MNYSLGAALCLSLGWSASLVQASTEVASKYLSDAQEFYRTGQYFKAARYAFAAGEADPSLEAETYSWATLGLLKAGLPNAASYFFIRTLQTSKKAPIRRVLPHTQDLLVRVGADVLRKYLIRYTTYEDYDAINRSAYLYALAKDALLKGDEERSIGYLNGITRESALWPFALQLRASAFALQGKNSEALRDFQACATQAHSYASRVQGDSQWEKQRHNEITDLQARCLAGEARTNYQMDRFREADRVYGEIPKASLVWPDILFEQAWNSFAREEYNRTLGRLVSYKSPDLDFVFNSEADVLRAQAYLALCLYADANEVINDFNQKYVGLGEQVKGFVEKNSANLPAFYDLGRKALSSSLPSASLQKLMNRFVRSLYFQNMVVTESAIASEGAAIRRFDAMQPGVSHERGKGFPGFLDQVLAWRLNSVKLLGGLFIKNSLMDYHSSLIADFEKIAFIKLEMLGRAKHRLVYKKPAEAERSRGNVIPARRDDQYYWSFNGEFWSDELGDYVFGLESECGKE